MVRLKEENNAARGDAGGGRNGLNLRRTDPINPAEGRQGRSLGVGKITQRNAGNYLRNYPEIST